MKLRNKKTGEIIHYTGSQMIDVWYDKDNEKLGNIQYSSLAELNEEWEDYEEPEGWWFIDRCYEAHATNSTLRNIVADKEIGNYFETKEEAEKAVERLRAWKRLRDKGFRFTGFNGCSVDYDIDEQYRKYISQDLAFLFGGEE